MALSAASCLHYWSSRYGHVPVIGGRPVHSRASTARLVDIASQQVVEVPAATPRDTHRVTIDGEERAALLLEMARTNIVLQSRFIGNTSVWTGTNVTRTQDQVGADGTVNGATKIVATAANATCLQTTTLASSARYQTAYVRRITGSGAIDMTTDGGLTWVVIPVTADWTRVSIPTQTVTNPHVGFRIRTSGDAIAVDFVQNENGTFATSPIVATSAATTRSADSLYWDFLADMQAMMIYCLFVEGGTASTTSSRILQLGGTTEQFLIFQDGALGTYKIYWDDSVSARSSVPGGAVAVGDVVEILMVLQSNGAVQGIQSINRGAVSAGAESAALALPASLGTKKLWAGTSNAGDAGATSLAEVKIVKYADVVASTAQGRMDELRNFELGPNRELLSAG